ncbi:MAG: DUF892 family protein [Bacteroidetes bacterium]|nr:DUF892 family protein [Bacteroidota bacterium]
MAKLNSLKDLFEDQLKAIYYAEKKIKQHLSLLVNKVDSDELGTRIVKHINLTKSQVFRLEQVFEMLNLPAEEKISPAMNGILNEMKEMSKEDAGPMVKDAGIIAGIQKVLHYKIACYETLKIYAKLLKQEAIEILMVKTIKEEKDADLIFTEMAVSINKEALSGFKFHN